VLVYGIARNAFDLEEPSMPHVLDTELKTYEQIRDRLLAMHEGKFALIHDKELIGVYDAEMDAINEGYGKLGNIPFLVKQIVQTEKSRAFISHLV
jgi:hypothetical protein